MTRIFILLLASFWVYAANGQSIIRPAVEFTNTGIYYIKRIQLSNTSTTVDLHITFIPKWWTDFGKDIFLEDAATGKKYMVKGIKGAEFDKKLFTPASGDTTVSLEFPALDRHVKKLNYGEGKKTYIFGIATDGSKVSQKDQHIPKSAQKWLDHQISQAKVKSSNKNYELDFFRRDSIKIVGYIKGYDKRAGFSSGIIYHQNILTREDHPTTIRIYEDGRFEAQLIAFHPIQSMLVVNDQHIPFYAEPGNTIGITLDWRDFLRMDRYRDHSRTFQYTEYIGAGSKINTQLADFKLDRPDYRSLEKIMKTVSPKDFKTSQIKKWTAGRKRMDSVLAAKKLLPQVQTLLKNQLDLSFANYLFEYQSNRRYFAEKDTGNAVLKIRLPEDYFDFVSNINLNNNALLINSDFSTFINRFEYSPLFPQSIYGKNDYYTALDSSIYVQYKTKEIPLIMDIAKLRTLDFKIEHSKTESDTQLLLTSVKRNMQPPFFKEEADRLLKQHESKKVGYELPNTANAQIFKNIIDKHKGKILIVDFWAQWCGPCRGGIEHSLAMRKKYKDNPDFDFVFITDLSGTPDTQFFNNYNEKNFMVNSYRVNTDEYLALRELFKFNGIPRYVLVDDKGKIRNDNFQSYNFAGEMVKHFPDKFNDQYFR